MFLWVRDGTRLNWFKWGMFSHCCVFHFTKINEGLTANITSYGKNWPKSLIINLHRLHHCLGKNTAQSIAHRTFSFFHWNICTYRKSGLLHTTDNCVLYCLSKEITPDLRLHYFKPQFLGAFLWKRLDKTSQTFSGSPMLVNGAKSQSIWMHKKKIPLTVILQTTSKGERKKYKHKTQQKSVSQRKHHSYSYSKIFTLHFKMYSSISQATSTLCQKQSARDHIISGLERTRKSILPELKY